jgi:hypothetical protein
MLPKAYIHHELPHRYRIHIPTHKGKDDFFMDLRSKLAQCGEIDGVEINPKTGSVVIHHQGSNEKIAQFAKNNQLFSLEPQEKISIKIETIPLKRILKHFERLNQKIIKHSQGQIDINMLVFGGLIGLAITQTANGKFLPPAWTLASQAISVLRFVEMFTDQNSINKRTVSAPKR